jgi:hypothetical protein
VNIDGICILLQEAIALETPFRHVGRFNSHDYRLLLPTSGAVEDFIRLADAKGFYVDDLIRMVESGMSAQHIADTVVSTFP